MSTWPPRELADEAVKRGIVEQISPRTVERFLKVSALQPHRKRYWLTPPPVDPAELAEQICTACEVYEATPALAAQGTHVMSTDEMTGVQAPTAIASLLADAAWSCRATRIRRHAAWDGCRLIANLEVATGRVVMPSLGPTRTEADFAAHIAQTIRLTQRRSGFSSPSNESTHQSETVVRLVAAQGDIQEAPSHQRQKRPPRLPGT